MSDNDILVVEDDLATQALIGSMLQDHFRLAFAGSRQACFTHLGTSDPNLILLDIMLPDASGLDICAEISGDARYTNLPIIMVTARDRDADVQRGLERGAVDYIKKPIRQLELVARVNSALKTAHLVKKLRDADMENRRLIEKLEAALKQVKELSGLLPICAECKKIRDEDGKWNQLEEYVHTHSEARFSHSICPNCASNLYGNESWYKKIDSKK